MRMTSQRHGDRRRTRAALWSLTAILSASLFATLLATFSSAQEAPGVEAPREAEANAGPVVRIVIDSPIHPVARQYLAESLAHAAEIDAVALVVELNTPGGDLASTREMFKAMLTARVPVIVYVSPSGAQAASAGFFLLMAADVAAMAPGTNTGAAHPVGPQGKDIEGHLGTKVEQDAAATIRSLAKRNGRNVELAEAAVVESLSFTAEEALEKELIDLVVSDFGALLRAVDGRRITKPGEEEVVLRTAEARVEEREMPAFQRILSVLIHPEIAYILMALGFLGLYVEISNPGAILPGVVGAICLILGFYALSVLPVNFAGVGLILLALVLFVAELFVISHGVLTIGGVVALVLGSMMLFKDADPALRLGLEVILAVSAVLLAVTLGLLAKAVQVRRGRVVTGAEGLVSERGEVRRDLHPRGKVFVHGELWTAIADSAGADAPPIPAGTPVEVVAVDGMTLTVRRLEGSAPPAAGKSSAAPSAEAPSSAAPPPSAKGE